MWLTYMYIIAGVIVTILLLILSVATYVSNVYEEIDMEISEEDQWRIYDDLIIK